MYACADLDNDGFIPLQDLASTDGIERKLVDDVVDDIGVWMILSGAGSYNYLLDAVKQQWHRGLECHVPPLVQTRAIEDCQQSQELW